MRRSKLAVATASGAALTLGASLIAGCAVSTKDTSDGDIIKVVAQAGGPGESLKAAAEEYTKQGLGNVSVDLFDYDGVRERTILGFNSGRDSYDVFDVAYEWMPEYIDAGYLRPMDEDIEQRADVIDLDDFVPAYVDWATVDGTQYVLPWFGAVYMLYYRTDLLEEAGVDVPTTWEEYVDAARTLQEATGVTGTTLIGKRDDPLMCEFWSIAWSFGADIWDGSQSTVDSPETLEALELWKNVLSYAPQDALSADWPAAAAAFSEGKTAMMINFSDTTDAILADGVEIADKVGFALLPAGPTGVSTPNLGGHGLGISSASDKAEEAMDFIAWATSAEQQEVGLDHGGSTNRISLLEDPVLQERFPYYAAALENYRQAVYFPVTADWVDWEAAIAPSLSEGMAGTTPTADAVSAAGTNLSKLIVKE
ncbi:extracellular solute-binding protein [Actinomycetaceae bacterium MB13-C1-2]|nr:extracellular solute-binding protein [Actinomycetaceae bacterium MB13-C1-2]